MSGSSATTDRSSGEAISRSAAPAGLAGVTRAVSVPARNHSVRGASIWPSKVIASATTPSGGAGAPALSLATRASRAPARRTRPGCSAALSLRCSASITVRHTGAAPVTPDTACIGAPPALPTHTPTV